MAQPPLLKHLNERAILDAIRSGAPISRAEISRRAGISKPTVSLALQSLLDAGLVREAAAGPGGPSYGAVYFEPVDEAALVVGFDLGARFLRGAICDLRGRVRARQDVELARADAEEALETIRELCGQLVRATALDGTRVDGVTVGVPGVVASSGALRLAENVPGLEGRRFGDELRDHLGLPVTLENDINLAALGERWRGVARGVGDFVFLSVGTGMGAGLVLAGELHRGHHGAAGEIDFALGGDSEESDPSAPAVSALAARLTAKVDGGTRLEPPFEARDVFAAARAADRVARDVVDDVARRIALHIAPIAAVADVELVVLGGGLGANGDLLLEPVRARLADWLPFAPRLEVSSLGEAAVLTGALAVGLDSARENVFANRSGGPAS
jgi:predicted NBD/HSP70 family sugar kinase